MMETSNAGAEHGFDYESPQAVAAATVAAMVEGSLTVVRGGESRAQMIDLNRNAAVDRFLAGRKPALEQAVAGHSGLWAPNPRRSRPTMTPPLFSPYRLGDLELANRLVMVPMTRNRASADGVPTPSMVTCYTQRATAGLIVTEGTQPSVAGQGYPFTPGIHTDEHAAGWRRGG